VGRHAELAKIAGLLANPGCRLLTLVGVGSVGKTRLALAAAAQHLDDFSAGCEMTLDACVALARGELAEIASD
jgi:predicted ATPase